ncbi:MAG: DNA internalization-related competence protein ComEC/Rec2, partial [Proteobacteria bacterium]|nr:DNA internalization-related competence protein ComEC/Rec2 [Pseudomonadota bacterium]
WYKQNSSQSFNFKPGQRWQLEVKLKPPVALSNPAGFDREKWLFRHRIDALGTIKSAQLLDDDPVKFMGKIHRWRYRISNLIDDAFEDPRSKGLILALSIGDKSKLDSTDYQLFQSTGTAHLIAISGLHIGIIAGFGLLLGKIFFRLFPSEKPNRILWQIAFSLLLAACYAALAGLSTPTVRALIMLVSYGVLRLGKRAVYGWDVWSVALIAVLIVDPLNVLDPGFWLSFGAVALLIYSYRGVKKANNIYYPFIKAQIVMLIGLLPISLLVFAELKLLAPLVNLIFIPLMSFLMVPILFISLFAGILLGHIPMLLINLMDSISQVMFYGLEWFANWEQANISFSISHWFHWLLLLSFSIIILSPKVMPQRWLAFLLLIPLFQQTGSKIEPADFKVNFFDVGQGLAVLIRTTNHVMIYDVGAKYDSGFNMSEAVILPYLVNQHIKKIDRLIISHQDNDHAGSVGELLKNISIEQHYDTSGGNQACITGTNWQWDGVSFEIISPYNLNPYFGNNSSCVVKISNRAHSILLTGDIEEAVEYRLTHQFSEKIQSNVLLVPHHGSKTSSSAEFIKTVNPSIAINSSGFLNPFKHPVKQVKQRYLDQNIAFYDTQDLGMIQLDFVEKIKITSHRNQQTHIWSAKKPVNP